MVIDTSHWSTACKAKIAERVVAVCVGVGDGPPCTSFGFFLITFISLALRPGGQTLYIMKDVSACSLKSQLIMEMASH